MNKLLFLLLVVAVMTVTAGCGSLADGRIHDTTTVSIKDIQPGDKIAGLLVVSVEYFDNYNFTVNFSGRLTLSGFYVYRSPDDYTGGVGFKADEESLQKLPQILEDRRDPGFFVLYPPTKFAPVGSRGTATIVIDQYRLVHREMGITNSARLFRLVKKGP